MWVGLGTGRAAAAGIVALGARVQGGLRCTAVATSRASTALAREQGIPIARLRRPLDLAFDGADAVDPHGRVIKGAGGAMVRERIVASAAARFVILVDPPKLVENLDEWGVLPLAVVPFATTRVQHELRDLTPTQRNRRSDDGLALIDLQVPTGSDWDAVVERVAGVVGVVDHGMFHVSRADVIVGTAD